MTQPRALVHLIRHGDALPPDDATIGTGGYDDLSLSAKGLAQAKALGERLASSGQRPVAVYSSPTLRAQKTAAAIATALGTNVVIDDRLREIHLGEDPAVHLPPGERAAAVRARLDELAAIALRDGSWDAVPGCESGSAVRERMQAALDAIARRHVGEIAAVVSHAGSINAYLAAVLGLSRHFCFPLGNTSVSTVRYADHPPLVVRVNDTAHLERSDSPR